MSTLEIRAIDKARQNFKNAKRELELARIQMTNYRGIPYEVGHNPLFTNTKSTLTYRGNQYTK